jgi:hypothetical protein
MHRIERHMHRLPKWTIIAGLCIVFALEVGTLVWYHFC